MDYSALKNEKSDLCSTTDEVCYGLTVCIPLNHMLKSNPQCDDIRKWGLWDMSRSRGWSPPEWD